MTSIVMLSVDQLDPHPHNPRRDLGDLADLAKSIKVQGIRQNLLVTPTGEYSDAGPGLKTARYTVIIGHRRLAAAKLAHLANVPCVVEYNMTDADQLELMLLENIQRSDLTLIEEAEGYQGLLDLGMSEATIAKNVGRSTKVVHGRVQLLTLPETARERIHNGQGSLVDAAALEAFADEPEVQERLAGKIGTVDFGRLVQEAKNARKLRAEQAPIVEALLAAGATESAAHPNGYHYDRQISSLDELAKYSVPKGAVFSRSTWSASVTVYTLDVKSESQEQADREAQAFKWEQERAANEARRASIKAAYEVRDEWLRNWPAKKVTAVQRDAILKAAPIALFEEYVPLSHVGEWFGAKNDYDGKKAKPLLMEWLDSRDPVSAIVLYLHLAYRSDLNGRAILFFDALRECGYVVSEFEQMQVLGEPITEDGEDDPDE